MDNSQGYAEAYKDVIHWDAIRFGGATKAPDYCFRLGGVRKFFVEARKPSVARTLFVGFDELPRTAGVPPRFEGLCKRLNRSVGGRPR
jgi:hypothetical protein